MSETPTVQFFLTD